MKKVLNRGCAIVDRNLDETEHTSEGQVCARRIDD